MTQIIHYGTIVALVVVSIWNLKNWIIKEGTNTKIVSFFLMSTTGFTLLIVKEFLDLCWIKAAISHHVFRHDLDSYLFDERRLYQIREEIQVARKIQFVHSVEVDLKDSNLPILFDERFNEENIRRLEKEQRKKNKRPSKRIRKESSGNNSLTLLNPSELKEQIRK